ncbi:MAG: ABC transporter permease [Hyphomicrobiaceae bacterium]|nr:MAG: ABC transporter permease [Hyphomicrobiaceae bacterium]
MTSLEAAPLIHAPGAAGRLLRAFRTNKLAACGLLLLLAVLALAALAPLFALQDPAAQDVLHKLERPSAAHLFGSDEFGRDIWARTVHGARISLLIGLASTALAVLIGSLIGVLAGWYGGRLDAFAMQVMDILLAFPSLILGMIVVAMLGPSLTNIVLAIALTSIAPFARIARAPTIAIKGRDFIDACRSFGFSTPRILFAHVLPNIFGEILVMAALWLASAIRTEASLAFIGLGLKPPIPTWGGMIREGFDNILDNPWLALVPGTAVLVVIFALNLMGDGLRDAVDPRLKDGT